MTNPSASSRPRAARDRWIFTPALFWHHVEYVESRGEPREPLHQGWSARIRGASKTEITALETGVRSHVRFSAGGAHCPDHGHSGQPDKRNPASPGRG